MTREEQVRLLEDIRNEELSMNEVLTRVVLALPVTDAPPVAETVKPKGKFQTGDAILDSEAFRRSVNDEWADLLEQLADYDALSVLVGRRILEDRRSRPTHSGFVQPPSRDELREAVGELLDNLQGIARYGAACKCEDCTLSRAAIARVRAALGKGKA